MNLESHRPGALLCTPLVALLACADSPATRPPARPAPARTQAAADTTPRSTPTTTPLADDAAVPAPREPLRLPAQAGEAADWVRPPLPDEARDPLGSRTVSQLGDRAALVRTRAGAFRIHRADGVSGPIRPPGEDVWLGLDGRDRVLAVDQDGRLFRARGGDGWNELAQIDQAAVWDAAGRHVVVGTGAGAVHVSRNGGNSFRRTVIDEGARVTDLVVRHDGAMVARLADGVTYLSRRGNRWRKSRLQPRELVRTGAWIQDPAGSCRATLSRDGRRWVRPRAEPFARLLRQLEAWRARLEHSEDGGGFSPAARLPSRERPPAPRYRRDREVTGTGDDCHTLGVGGFGLSGTGGGGSGRGLGGAGPFYVLRGTHGSPPPETDRALHLLHDGACADADAVRGSTGGACSRHASWTRAPHPVWLDRSRSTASVHPLPDACSIARTDNARGLGFLVCGAGPDRTSLWSFTGDGFTEETRLDGPPDDLAAITAAADGTVVAFPDCRRDCEISVRRPAPAGSPGAWRRTSIPDAVAYRAAPGGAVVALVARGRRAMAFAYEGPHRPARSLTEDIAVPPGWVLTAFDIDSGRIVLQTRDGDGGEHRVFVTADGSLEPVEVD